jgi:hypothetical protein
LKPAICRFGVGQLEIWKMSISAPPSNFKRAPEGTFPAICSRVIELGSHPSTFNGKTRMVVKVRLGFELKDEDCLTDDGEPLLIYRTYNYSFAGNSSLGADIEGMVGKFNSATFRLEQLLGVRCLVTVVHEERDGATYANVGKIGQVPKGMAVGTLVDELLLLDLDPAKFNQADFDRLPDKTQEMIKQSPEYAALKGNGNGSASRAAPVVPKLPGDPRGAYAPALPKPAATFDAAVKQLDDEIPF